MKDQLKFTVSLTAGDLWQFSMYHANGGMTGIFNVLFTLASLFVLFYRWGTLTVPYRLLLVCCALIFPVLQPLLLFNKVRRQAKTPAIQNPMELTFDKEGLLVEQNEQQVRFAWDQMGRLERKPTLTILYMDRLHAYLLPKRALEGQEAEFQEMAREHLPRQKRRGI